MTPQEPAAEPKVDPSYCHMIISYHIHWSTKPFLPTVVGINTPLMRRKLLAAKCWAKLPKELVAPSSCSLWRCAPWRDTHRGDPWANGKRIEILQLDFSWSDHQKYKFMDIEPSTVKHSETKNKVDCFKASLDPIQYPQCISLKNHVSAGEIHINSPSTARRLEDWHCSHSCVWYASVSLGESLETGKIQQRANPSVSTGRCSSKVKAVDHQHSCNGPQSESRT